MRLAEFMTAYRRSFGPDPRMLDGDAQAALDVIAEVGRSPGVDSATRELLSALEMRLSLDEPTDGGMLLMSWLFGLNDAFEWGRLLQRALGRRKVPKTEEFNQWVNEKYALRANALFGIVDTFTEGQRFRLEEHERYLATEDAAGRLVGFGGIREILDAADHAVLQGFARVVGESSLHMVQRHTLLSWTILFSRMRGEHLPPAEVITAVVASAQVLIARQALSLMRLKRALELPEWRANASVVGARAAINGVLAELDVAIAILPIMTRGEPGQFLVFAAPPQFEMFAGSANADLIVVDALHRRARGIQVKSSSRAMVNREYDSSRVSVVYAADELGEFLPVTGQAGEPRLHAPSPGLFSMRYLSTVSAYRTWVKGVGPTDLEYFVRTADDLVPSVVSAAGQHINSIATAGSAPASGAEHQRTVRRGKQETRRNHERVSELLIDRILGEL